MFRHTVRSRTITINAPIEKVWAVLKDLPKYAEWNPFTYRVESSLAIGDPVDLYVRFARRGERIQREYVRAVEPPHTLSWGMHMGHEKLLSALREQILLPLGKNSCSYQTSDHFEGLLTPLVVGLFGRDIEDGFNAVGMALKQRAEFHPPAMHNEHRS